MIESGTLILYILWRGVLLVIVSIGWGIGYIVGKFIGGIVAGYLKGYKG